ncbi:hypothetical protein RB195_017799 [Necator americanus]|uniref:Uncharacterized protein n=1 Tax=Necator americanus TaxID=51031 RepID=A0ABR1C8F9_NECAM
MVASCLGDVECIQAPELDAISIGVKEGVCVEERKSMRWGRCVAITWLNTLDADCTEKERDFQLMRRAYLIERAATILRRLYDKTFGSPTQQFYCEPFFAAVFKQSYSADIFANIRHFGPNTFFRFFIVIAVCQRIAGATSLEKCETP